MRTWLWIVSIVSIIGLCLFFSLYFNITKVKYEKEFEIYANEFNVDKALVVAVAKTESGFDKNATSSAGAIGIMQLMPGTASWVASEIGEEYDKEKLYDAKTNIRYGTFYLSYLLGKYEDLVFTLACYNAGEGIVRSWGIPGELKLEDIKYAETANFIKKVLKNYESLKV